MSKKLLLGNAAFARGVYEAGCRFVSSYPGTPSTEITYYVAQYDEVYAEWAPNEKVGMEAALGASIAGARAFCGMKHVGLNVAADPLFSAAYTGVNGGLVFVVADDSGMHSSQDEQDSRHLAIMAKVPMLEPADSSECLNYTKRAFELSEQFDTPVLVRSNTRISHSTGVCEVSERQEIPLKEYEKDVHKYVMVPTFARGRHVVVEERMAKLREFAETCEFNTVENNGTKTGIITAGISYQYAKEVFGDSVSYLKLGLVNPMPEKMIKDFAAKFERVLVIEELDDVIQTYCQKLGLKVEGKELLTNIGEYSQEYLREKLLGEKLEFVEIGARTAETTERAAMTQLTATEVMKAAEVPQRPPVMCPGCSHRGIFYVINKLGLFAAGDIGCYTLGAFPPLNALDTCLCMGAGVSALHGFNKVRAGSHKQSIGVIGDSTFMHSGVTGLIDIVYNKGLSKILVVDNLTTGMTGHQDHPSTGKTLKGEDVPIIAIEDIAKACGIKDSNIRIVDPCDVEESERVLKEELAKDEPSVVIARRPCVLLKYVKKDKKYEIKDCKKCKICMKVGCPAIAWSDANGAEINPALCNGCGLCANLCKPGCVAVK